MTNKTDPPPIAPSAPPAGFEPHFRKSPMTAPWEPLYSKVEDTAVLIGLLADDQHTNSRGFVHGGLIATLADNAMGLSCAHQLSQSRLVTTNLNIDFLGTAQKGMWLVFNTQFIKTGRTLCFAQCFVEGDGNPVARANATFRVTPA